MDSTAYGERNAITVGTETREISGGRWPTTTVSPAISRKVKCRATPSEKSDEVTYLGMVETTQLGRPVSVP